MDRSTWTVEVRDPYMGNWIPLRIVVEGKAISITVIQGEGIEAEAEREEDERLD